MARTCTICTHPDRQDIDLAVVSGQSHQDISASFRVSHDAVQRHSSNHIGVGLKKAAQRRTDLRADDLLAAMVSVADEAREAHGRAKEDGNDRLALSALREVRETIKAIALMTPAPEDEEVLALVQGLGVVLPRHPEAAVELAQELWERGHPGLADLLGSGVRRDSV